MLSVSFVTTMKTRLAGERCGALGFEAGHWRSDTGDDAGASVARVQLWEFPSRVFELLPVCSLPA